MKQPLLGNHCRDVMMFIITFSSGLYKCSVLSTCLYFYVFTSSVFTAMLCFRVFHHDINFSLDANE